MLKQSAFVQIENRIYSFWRLQALGWMVYLLAYYFHLILFRTPQALYFVRILIIIACGFLTSTLLRHFYKRIDYASKSLWSLSLIIFIGAVLSANLWFWASRFIAMVLLQGVDAYSQWIRTAKLQSFIMPLFFDMALFVSWGALYFSIKLWVEWNEQRMQLETANLSTQQSQFQMLRYQLNPHFLFNALNAIRALIVEDRQKAKKMITELSEFLRYSLISRDHPLVPFQQEIEAIRRYLTIEQIRYEDKLEVSMQLEPRALEYPVMAFLVHPLVENAVRYGMRTSPMPLKVTIVACADNGTFRVEIINTGRWIGPLSIHGVCSNGSGNSLTCIRQRLEATYSNGYRLDIAEDGNSVHVLLELNQRVGV